MAISPSGAQGMTFQFLPRNPGKVFQGRRIAHAHDSRKSSTCRCATDLALLSLCGYSVPMPNIAKNRSWCRLVAPVGFWDAWYRVADTVAGWNPWLLRRELRFRGYQVRAARSLIGIVQVDLMRLEDEMYPLEEIRQIREIADEAATELDS